jgi:hypothetical protein
LRADSPKRNGAAMAQRSFRAACKHRRHPSAQNGQLGTTNGVHPTHHAVQSPNLEPMLDRVPTQPQLQKLPPGNNPMLLPGNLPNRSGRLAS